MPTYLIIANQPVIRKGIISIFSDRFGEFQLTCELDQFDSENPGSMLEPDLVILGIADDKREQYPAVAAIRIRFPQAVLLTYGYEVHSGQMPQPQELATRAITYLKCGANAYLSSRCTLDEFFSCVETILKGRQYVSSELQQLLFDRILVKTAHKNENIRLTKRESQIAHLLVKGMKPKAIAQTLDLRASTVSTLKQRVFKKFDVDNIVRLKEVLI